MITYHVIDKVWPFQGKVLLAYDSNGSAQLLLNRWRRLQHQVDNARLDRLAIFRMDLVSLLLIIKEDI